MAGFTPLEAQWLADGGRISVRALARALGLDDHKELHRLIEQETEELEYYNDLVVCLIDPSGTDNNAKEFFLSESQCCVLVFRDEFEGSEAFAYCETLVGRVDSDNDGEAAALRGQVH